VVVGSALLAEPIAQVLGLKGAASAKSSLPQIAVASIAFMLVFGTRLMLPIGIGNGEFTPTAALDHLPEGLANAPMFNQYELGGFLIFKGYRPFIDGRTDMYGDEFLANYFEIQRGAEGRLKDTLAKYRIAWAILSPGSRATELLSRLPGWKIAYRDAFSVLYLRN
jgi:hypothetical protein